MKLPRVTLDEFLSFNPCWRNSEQGRRRLRYYARKLGRSADALEILALRRIPAEERLWAVLRAEFIPDRILHRHHIIMFIPPDVIKFYMIYLYQFPSPP